MRALCEKIACHKKFAWMLVFDRLTEAVREDLEEREILSVSVRIIIIPNLPEHQALLYVLSFFRSRTTPQDTISARYEFLEKR
mmetsp:Transcript_2001/g.7208  ORF Transcript_2001/g.7208 Transcript_2001/m.7208 type:complete len:83 (+) Transcript_2001:406-654(+)